MKWIIDRFEGDFAVVELERTKMVNIPKQAFPPDTKEGDVITVQIDRKMTEDRRAELSKQLKDLWN